MFAKYSTTAGESVLLYLFAAARALCDSARNSNFPSLRRGAAPYVEEGKLPAESRKPKLDGDVEIEGLGCVLAYAFTFFFRNGYSDDCMVIVTMLGFSVRTPMEIWRCWLILTEL